MNTAAELRIIPLTEKHCRDICTWRYPVPYDIYNWPSWEEMLKKQEEFADPQLREEQYRAVLDTDGELVGFAQFFPMVGVTRLGLGMRPELCGQGYGAEFVRAIAAEAARRAPADEIDLEVLIWNIRAYRVYEKAGFVHTDTYERMTPTGMEPFHCMVWKHSGASV
ncbi:GNAT family N-acetyltransferase [Paenibacillus doosanensis]|uniref:Acetyltransferase (GNAT) family protein n=1 Tax=Paenibacillus konkukensis TaxID=2020716 RepID=A0ABY4RQP3_9BACL|nr:MULTISPECIES: GNAT family N-acetyltransferase [Paenibacillus]MCS7464848.1 GNAT family N-acetyltransferase [Paenibacillus doosanensis]UQZ84831.1 Acetyltransferase (GNAT) family protein [Paenibacillus konkukensis]